MLAEDLLLLLVDDVTGKPILDSTRLDLALAGAMLIDLAAAGRLRVAESGEEVKSGRLVADTSQTTGDAVLDDVLRRIAEHRPSKPETVLPRIAKGLRQDLLTRLVGRGILRAEEGRILGIFPTSSWPAVDSEHETEVREGLRRVLVDGEEPGPTETGLISLLHAVNQVHKVLPDREINRRELKRRAKAIAEGEFVGEAVSRAVASVTAAVVAGVAVATSVASASGE